MNSILRYLSISIIFLIGYAFWSAIGPIIFKTKWFLSWCDFYLNLAPWLQCIILFLSGFIIKNILLWSGDYNINQEIPSNLKSFKYPPIRYAIAFNLILSIYYSDIYPYVYFDYQLLFLVLGLSFLFPYDLISIWKKNDKKTNNPSSLLTEVPIKSFDEDLYDRRPIVDRILKRIKSNNYNSLKGQTIVGDYGCGKTSLLNLIEGCIDKKDNIIICKFDSWGRITDAQQGQKLILEKIIEDIGKYTGVSDIKSVPKDYLNSLSGIDSRLKGIIDIINATSLDTEKQLNKIDNTLKAINKKLLVFIEDIDRNNNSEELANDISPLLDRLVCAPHITFIFTIGYDTHISSIINRITNYREDLVTDDRSAENLLTKFRELSINYKKEKTINLDHIYESKVLKSEYTYKEAYNAIMFYTKNPRIAKYYLRGIYESWSNLFGEVDFDDLLMILLLKYCEPSAYDYLIENIRTSNIKDKTVIEKSFKDNAEFFKNTDMASSLIIYILNNNNKICINRPQSIASCDNGDKKEKYLNLIINNYIPDDYEKEKPFIKEFSYLKDEISTNNIINNYDKLYAKYLSLFTLEQSNLLARSITCLCSNDIYSIAIFSYLCYINKENGKDLEFILPVEPIIVILKSNRQQIEIDCFAQILRLLFSIAKYYDLYIYKFLSIYLTDLISPKVRDELLYKTQKIIKEEIDKNNLNLKENKHIESIIKISKSLENRELQEIIYNKLIDGELSNKKISFIKFFIKNSKNINELLDKENRLKELEQSISEYKYDESDDKISFEISYIKNKLSYVENNKFYIENET